MLVQPESAEQRDDDVSEGRGWHYKGEIGPAQRRHVACEKADQQHNAGENVWIGERMKEQTEMVQVNWAHLAHAVREQHVSNRSCEHDGGEDGVLGGLELVLHEEKVNSCKRKRPAGRAMLTASDSRLIMRSC